MIAEASFLASLEMTGVRKKCQFYAFAITKLLTKRRINPKKDKKREIVNIALNNCDELLRIENSKNRITRNG